MYTCKYCSQTLSDHCNSTIIEAVEKISRKTMPQDLLQVSMGRKLTDDEIVGRGTQLHFRDATHRDSAPALRGERYFDESPPELSYETTIHSQPNQEHSHPYAGGTCSDNIPTRGATRGLDWRLARRPHQGPTSRLYRRPARVPAGGQAVWAPEPRGPSVRGRTAYGPTARGSGQRSTWRPARGSAWGGNSSIIWNSVPHTFKPEVLA